MATTTTLIAVEDYALAMTLNSGQSFIWQERDGAWEGVIGTRWVRLTQRPAGILAEAVGPVNNWNFLTHYLQSDINLAPVLASFPTDAAMQRSVAFCRGLRLLRQDPWECLASFILSSTKQIVQIRQIVGLLSRQFGTPVVTGRPGEVAYAFPTPEAVVAAGEAQLRACKMGFRAPNLWATARMLADQELNLNSLYHRTLDEARAELLRCPGVGPKIANCVLLFAFGFPKAFPVDVWIMKALRQLYFPRRRPRPDRLLRFVERYFGENSGYAQQYLFHYMRTAPSPTGQGEHPARQAIHAPHP